jgi:hypothetical protein
LKQYVSDHTIEIICELTVSKLTLNYIPHLN